ncbi:MAG: DUF2252 domain-containing protein [Acidimicrobiaceae bacterium]|nr:DUF2252 domain-containing protein [Acidimicrobiaceae bacterium]
MKTGDKTSVAQRRLEGRRGRLLASRGSLGVLAQRPEGYDVVGRLLGQDHNRLAPLLPLRWQRMLESPLSFLRGSALIMAEDLARGSSAPMTVQICGDAHLSNFGIFSSPERRLVFDLTDFDETDQGPFEWDVKRLVTSLIIAGESLGLHHGAQERLARSVAREYRVAIRRFAEETRLDVWYSTLTTSSMMKGLRGSFTDVTRRNIEDVLHHLRGTDDASAYHHFVVAGENPRIVEDAPHFTHLEGIDATGLSADDVLGIVASYDATLPSDRQLLLSQFTPVDVARHVVGVGSVGTECFAVLLSGRDNRDTFFLQIKEAQRSVVSLAREREATQDSASRVVHGQRVMQVNPDAFLGWGTIEVNGESRSFYVRQLYDHRASIDVERLDGTLLKVYGRICAWTLARAHARSGNSAQIAGYIGGSARFDEAISEFAQAYRERNAHDYRALHDAVVQGRISTGV